MCTVSLQAQYVVGTPSSATGTIADDDTATFTINDVTIINAFLVNLAYPLTARRINKKVTIIVLEKYIKKEEIKIK